MADRELIWIEPQARLAVLASTLQARAPAFEAAWTEDVGRRAASGDGCLGRALYRHRSVFRGSSNAPAWSHLELSYFRGIVPAAAIRGCVSGGRHVGVQLLRAEILLTTPSSFVLPRGWRGSANQPGRRPSLEYIHVLPQHLDAYRDVMRRYVGPAAARLVAQGRIGTFRAMETVAVLYDDPALGVDWNQIHLCEVDAATFKGFGLEFDAALREVAPDGGFARVFADLDHVRSIPRWTFNDPVAEDDLPLGEVGSAAASAG